MADDKDVPGKKDVSRAAMGKDHEADYGTSKFGVSREALKRAAAAVGNSAEGPSGRNVSDLIEFELNRHGEFNDVWPAGRNGG